MVKGELRGVLKWVWRVDLDLDLVVGMGRKMLGCGGKNRTRLLELGAVLFGDVDYRRSRRPRMSWMMWSAPAAL